MSHDNLAQMDTRTAAKAVEQAGTKEFQEAGGFATQLLEMRDKNPQEYSQIMKQATAMANSETNADKKSGVLHELTLIDEMGTIQGDLKSGNTAEMQRAFSQLKQDAAPGDINFVHQKMAQAGAEQGFIVRAGDGKSLDSLIVHNPGSQLGVELTGSQITAYDWHTKRDVDFSGQEALQNWAGSGAPSDFWLRKETETTLKSLGKADPLSKVSGGDINDVGDLESIAYNHGYNGKTGMDAASALASDSRQNSGVDMTVSNFDSRYNTVDANINFGKATMTAGWQLEQ